MALHIDPEVARALNRKPELLAALTLHEFQMFAYLCGYDVRVAPIDVDGGNGGFRITMDPEHRPIINVGPQ